MAVCGSFFGLWEKGLKFANLVVRGDDALRGSSNFSLYAGGSVVVVIVEELLAANGFNGLFGIVKGILPIACSRCWLSTGRMGGCQIG